MDVRYRAALALTLALPLAGRLAAAKPPLHVRRHTALATTAEELYSQRALRRAKIILQLKLLELRSEHLDRVRRAIEKHVPIDELLRE